MDFSWIFRSFWDLFFKIFDLRPSCVGAEFLGAVVRFCEFLWEDTNIQQILFFKIRVRKS